MKLLLAYLVVQVVAVVILAITMPAVLFGSILGFIAIYGGFYLLARALGYGAGRNKAKKP